MYKLFTLPLLFLGIILLLNINIAQGQSLSSGSSVVLQWSNLTINLLTAQATLTSPARARVIALVVTAMYDAWAVYPSNVAVPTIAATNRVTKRVGLTGSDQNYAISINYAAYQTIISVFAAEPSFASQAEALLNSQGLSSGDNNLLSSSPSGLGNLAASNLLRYRLPDGSNQDGSEYPGPNVPYFDYTYFTPVNKPQINTLSTDCATVNLNHWFGLLLPGASSPQTFATAYWDRVKTFALPRWDYFRGSALPQFGSPSEPAIAAEHQTVLDYSGQLNDTTKAIVNFWSEQASDFGSASQWTTFALQSIVNLNIPLADSLILLLTQSNAAMDAGISSFGFKRYFTSARPLNVIPCYFAGTSALFWAGPYQGLQVGNVSNWLPYQPAAVPSPPHPDYTSIHATISSASARALRNFFGSDTFQALPIVVPAGSSQAEPIITAGNPGFISGVTDVPNTGPATVGYAPATDIPLSYPTWSAAAQDAGLSRIFGGIHTPLAVSDGLQFGQQIGDLVWNRVSSLVTGSFRRPEFP